MQDIDFPPLRSERYPPLSDDAGPLDPLIQVLKEAEATHQEKAIMLAALSRKEFQYAVNDGLLDEQDYFGWAESRLEMLDEVLAGV